MPDRPLLWRLRWLCANGFGGPRPPARTTNQRKRGDPTKEIRGQSKSPRDRCGAIWSASTARLVVRRPPGVHITEPQAGLYPISIAQFPAPRLPLFSHIFLFLPFPILPIDLLTHTSFYNYQKCRMADLPYCASPFSPPLHFTIFRAYRRTDALYARDAVFANLPLYHFPTALPFRHLYIAFLPNYIFPILPFRRHIHLYRLPTRPNFRLSIFAI